MKTRVLTLDDKQEVLALNEETYQTLENEAFFIPFEEPEIVDLLSENSRGELLAVIDNGAIQAVAGLLTELDDFTEDLNKLGHDVNDVIEIGGLMTKKSARGKGYVSMLNRILLDHAKEKGFKQVIATVHPENIASEKTLTKLQMTYIETISRHGKLRKFFIKEL